MKKSLLIVFAVALVSCQTPQSIRDNYTKLHKAGFTIGVGYVDYWFQQDRGMSKIAEDGREAAMAQISLIKTGRLTEEQSSRLTGILSASLSVSGSKATVEYMMDAIRIVSSNQYARDNMIGFLDGFASGVRAGIEDIEREAIQ